MSWLCLLGLHKWAGCKCLRCYKHRDTHHSWKDNCDRCVFCGKPGLEPHAWNGCKCSKCIQIRDEGHTWDGCKCSKCGKTRNEEHEWVKCKCVKCGGTRDDCHDWDESSNRCRHCQEIKCSVCGLTHKQVFFQVAEEMQRRYGHLNTDFGIFEKQVKTCPQCHKTFCRYHAARVPCSYSVDDCAGCPDCLCPLD